MKAFRVRDIGHVDDSIGFKVMDGIAYVPVGGSAMPYLTVSPALVADQGREGKVTDVELEYRGNRIELIACASKDEHALVLLPCGAFDFKAMTLVSPRDACRLVVMKPGDTIEAFPNVRSIAECDRARPARLHFDGQTVTFINV